MSNDKPSALAFNPVAIPKILKDTPRWVLWKFALKKKPNGLEAYAKIPFQLSGNAASTNRSESWATYNETFDALVMGEYDGMGLVIDGSDGIVGIDLDDCIRPDGSMTDLAQELLERVKGYAEVSPSGTGIKMFTRAKLGRQYVDNSLGIEVYPNGRYFTVTGHVINGYKEVPETNQQLDWFITKYFNQEIVINEVDALALYKSPLQDWDINRVRNDLLIHLDAECSYAEWVQVGQALFHQFNGETQALDLWDAWSAGLTDPCSKYLSGLCEDKWESFTQQRDKGNGPVTLASIIKRVGEVVAREKKENADRWFKQVTECMDSHTLRDDICTGIANDAMLDSIGREVLAQLIKNKFRTLDYPIPVDMVRQMLRSRTSGFDYSSKPGWLDEWVYVTHEDKFFHLGTKRRVSIQGFNALYNREMGEADDANSAKAALELWQIPVVSRVMYIPWAGDIFTDSSDGQIHANTYRPTSVPAVVAEWDEASQEACQIVERHFMLLCDNDKETCNWLKLWIAHNVQHPGVKIRWSPLIKGIQGDGKSTVGKIISSVMGPDNVSEVSPKAIATDFNGWAEGSCVNVLDEIRISGHNRYDIADRLKPYISNDRIPIHRKGVDEYTSINTVNYIAFTNHSDALPLEESDRRWLVLFTPFRTKEQLVAVANDQYFNRLHDAIYVHGGALRRWFLEMDIPEIFKPNGHAPYTDAKRIMTNMSISDEELMMRDIIENGAPGVSKEVLDSASLSLVLTMTHGFNIRTSGLNKLIAKIGFDQLEWVVKWQGKTRRIWFKSDLHMNNLDKNEAIKQIREKLDATLTDSEVDIME
jgi:hypothetical protein